MWNHWDICEVGIEKRFERLQVRVNYVLTRGKKERGILVIFWERAQASQIYYALVLHTSSAETSDQK